MNYQESATQRSSILITGSPGIGKEALGYFFTQTGVHQGDFNLYVTRFSRHEILQDAVAFGIRELQSSVFWIAREGGQVKLNINDLPGIASEIRLVLSKNSNRKIRIVVDILSSLLMLNPIEAVYKFVNQLIEEVKQYDAVLLATLEEGMHPEEVQVAMQQLFDGFIEFSFHREGLKIFPLVRLAKIMGVTPRLNYYIFSSSDTGVQLLPAISDVSSLTRSRTVEILVT